MPQISQIKKDYFFVSPELFFTHSISEIRGDNKL